MVVIVVIIGVRQHCYATIYQVFKIVFYAGSIWRWLDTHNVSSTYKHHNNSAMNTQLPDGLHFDRRFFRSIEQHENARQSAIDNGQLIPGQLEMQIVQNLLNLLFHEELMELYNLKALL